MNTFGDMDKYSLTYRERNIFELLKANIGNPVSRENICKEIGIHPDYYVLSRAIDVHVSNIRYKVADDYEILTCRGIGYVMGKSNG